MKKTSDHHMLGHTLLRVSIGVMFLLAGINKLGNPDGVIGMLGNIGFPAAALFGWILILSEAIFGALVLVGYKTKHTAWPLAVILVVAWLTVSGPNGGYFSTNSLFHLMGAAASATIALTGPGKYAISKEE